MSDTARRWYDEPVPVPPRAADDESVVPYQVALPVQSLLDAILGEEYLSLEEIATLLAQLADLTSDGHGRDRIPWTGDSVYARVRELHEAWNPPIECGGEPPAELERV